MSTATIRNADLYPKQTVNQSASNLSVVESSARRLPNSEFKA
jgi:hypothetical protein